MFIKMSVKNRPRVGYSYIRLKRIKRMIFTFDTFYISNNFISAVCFGDIYRRLNGDTRSVHWLYRSRMSVDTVMNF